MKRWHRDVIYAAVIIVLGICGVFYANSLKQDLVTIPLAEPGKYTMLWVVFILVLAIGLLIQALIKRPQEAVEPIFDKMSVLTMVMLVLFVATVRKMGFLINAIVLVAVLTIAYSAHMGKLPKAGKAKWIYIGKNVLFAVLLGVSTQQLFTKILGANLPSFKLF